MGYSVESREKMQPGHCSFQSIPEGLQRARRGEKLGGCSVCPELYSEQQQGCVTALGVLGLTGTALTPL